MVAENLDLIEGASRNASLVMRVHLESATAQSQALTQKGNGNPPKVRKPYTIKKQREKWTEEEHQRFLEALKLYGRAWRQIEEHVGTKTAIQIRSHAQKFFAKVARDSNECEGSLNPIEIPPPRPKKKPAHPYPRKVDVTRSMLDDQHQPEQAPSSKRSSKEKNSGSPTSVLSALGSDTSGSPFSEPQRSHLSPVSYATDDAHSAVAQLMENDSECMTSDSSVEEEKEYGQTNPVAASANQDDKSTMDLLTLGRACSVEDPATEPAPTAIKLFGRMVEIKEFQKISSIAPENSELSPSHSMKEKLDIRNGHCMMGSTENNKDPAAFSLSPSCINPLACLVPQYPLSEECGQPGVIPHIVPWWTWPYGPALSNLSLGKETFVKHPERGTSQIDEPQREGSLTGSNSGSNTRTNAGLQNFDSIQSKTLTNIERQRSPRGFLPYKRCLAERDTKSCLVAAEQREGQRARVCS